MRFVAPQTKHDDNDDDDDDEEEEEAHPSVPKRTYVTGIELLSCGIVGELCEIHSQWGRSVGVWEGMAVLSLPDTQQGTLRNYLSNSHWPLTSNRQADWQTDRQTNRQTDRQTVRQTDDTFSFWRPRTPIWQSINSSMSRVQINSYCLWLGLVNHHIRWTNGSNYQHFVTNSGNNYSITR